MHLFLDDIRNPETTRHVYLPIPENGWKIVRDYNGFCNAINDYWQSHNTLPEFIAFDHDLSMEDVMHFQNNPLAKNGISPTGFDCAKWLVEFCMNKNIKFTSEFIVHSMNPVGKKNIESLLNQAKEKL